MVRSVIAARQVQKSGLRAVRFDPAIRRGSGPTGAPSYRFFAYLVWPMRISYPRSPAAPVCVLHRAPKVRFGAVSNAEPYRWTSHPPSHRLHAAPPTLRPSSSRRSRLPNSLFVRPGTGGCSWRPGGRLVPVADPQPRISETWYLAHLR